jgi:dTDP-4-amino-4,6-dideoxygalactose transaminase/CelD/BcsL family acetyltransferase involved in cellulose biosynthesis
MNARRISAWPPLPVGAYLRKRSLGLPFPLEDPRAVLFSRARQGLWHGVQAVGLRPGDGVLAPAYHHGSEIEALLAAGLVCKFYDVTETLEPDEDELEALLTPSVRALHLTHYLGFPSDSARWRNWCDERGLLLIEDAAQSWLVTDAGRDVGSVGDLAVFCVYKTVGVPDGAVLLCGSSPPTAGAERALELGPLARRHLAWLAGRSRLAARGASLRSARPYSADEDFALGDPNRGPSTAFEFLLRRVVDPSPAAARRANYQRMLEELADQALSGFDHVPDGASPFVFPLRSESKAKVLARLAGQGIHALDFWSVPHRSLPTNRFPRATALRSSIVGLPVHQELLAADVERITAAARTPRSPASRLRLERVLSFDALRDEWTELAEATGNIFSTFEWVSTWWRFFGSPTALVAHAVRSSDDRLVGIVPLYVSATRPFRVVRFIGHREGDHLGPICRPSERAAVATATLDLLNRQGFDIFVGDKMPAGQGWATFLDANVLGTSGSPVLHIQGRHWDEVLERMSRNLRQQVRRKERNLHRGHDVRFRLSDTNERLEQDLETLFQLHAARWGKKAEWFTATQAFHRAFAKLAFERGWLRLWLLEVDGAPVAAWYGFRYGGTESYYQAGRKPEWDRASVGFVLLAHSIRAAVEDGMREYRFLEGGEAYKYRFATEDRGLETVGRGGSAAGRAALRAAGAVRGRPRLAMLGRYLAG